MEIKDIIKGTGSVFKFVLPFARIYIKTAYPEVYAGAAILLPKMRELAEKETETEIDDKAISGLEYLLFGKKGT